MKYAAAFAHFWYDFVVGDDWQIAVAVAFAMATAGLLAYEGINAWWLLPLAVVAMLSMSLWRAARRVRPRTDVD